MKLYPSTLQLRVKSQDFGCDGIGRAGVDTFAGAAETRQGIGRAIGEAGKRRGRGDLRSPAVTLTPGRPERRETVRACAC